MKSQLTGLPIGFQTTLPTVKDYACRDDSTWRRRNGKPLHEYCAACNAARSSSPSCLIKSNEDQIKKFLKKQAESKRRSEIMCARCGKEPPTPRSKHCFQCQGKVRNEKYLAAHMHKCSWRGCIELTTGKYCKEHSGKIKSMKYRAKQRAMIQGEEK